MFNKSVLPLVIVFLGVSLITLLLRQNLLQKGVDWQVILSGNLFLYLITTISYHLLRESISAVTTAAFLRRVYASILLKLFGCAIAALAYILLAGVKMNKPAIFSLMGLYLVYSFMEMKVLMEHINRSKNARS